MANKFLNDLELGKLLELYRILDSDDTQWKTLCASLEFSHADKNEFALEHLRGRSPSEKMLGHYGHLNPTVHELFIHLERCGLFRAAEVFRGTIPVECFARIDAQRQQAKKKLLNQQSSSSSAPKQMSGDTTELPGPNSVPAGAIVGPGWPSSPSPQIGPGRVSYAVPTETMMCISQAPVGLTQHRTNREPVESECADTSQQLVLSGSHGNRTQIDNQQPVTRDEEEAAIQYTKKLPEEEVVEATDNFSPAQQIGSGGFGVVYKGYLKRLKLDVAIKKLKNEDYKEIQALFRYHHENIIQLVGYSKLKDTVCLVYVFMANGSLHDRLRCKNGSAPLSYFQRINILLGTAKGVHYLHNFEEKPLIHGDIKSGNILLDKHLEAKISDFGLAKKATRGLSNNFTHVTNLKGEKVYGSRAYLPREYIDDPVQLNIKTDTYSFGVVIFETLTGIRANDAAAVSKKKKVPTATLR